ncbi:hypothetical protein ACOME3_006600 [Neoechinorhynchus agilis]
MPRPTVFKDALMTFTINPQGDYTFMPVLITGIVFYCLCYKVLSPRISRKWWPEYSRLNIGQQKEWNTRINSTINALSVSLLCSYMLVHDQVLKASPLVYRSRLLRTNLSLLMGYLIADTFIMTRHYRLVGDLMSILHHIIAIVAVGYVVTLDVLPYLSNLRLTSEFSTPFVNMRWFLAVLHRDRSGSLFIMNGLLMTVVFFTCRVAIIPVFWYKVYAIRKITGWKYLGQIKLLFYVFCIGLDALNIYWFLKILKGCCKTLRSRHNKVKIN